MPTNAEKIQAQRHYLDMLQARYNKTPVLIKIREGGNPDPENIEMELYKWLPYRDVWTLAKSIRSRIGAEYPNLPYGGLTRREYAGKKAWEDKPEEEREKIIEKGKKSLKALHSQNQNDKLMVMFRGGSK